MSTEAEVRPRMWNNPVVVRELKERMRSPRAVWLLVGYLVLMSLVIYIAYQASLVFLQFRIFTQGGGFTQSALGRSMFEWAVLVLVGLVTFIAPGIAAGSIVSEKERRTLPLIQITLLGPRSIVVGKLINSMSFVALLILASAPIFAVPMMIGGVSMSHVLKGILVILLYALFVSSLGIYMSAVAKRTQFAIVAAYVLTLLFAVGPQVLLAIEFIARNASNAEGTMLSPFVNSLVAVAQATTDPAGNTLLPAPLTTLAGSTYQSGAQLVIGAPVGLAQFNWLSRNVVWMLHSAILVAFSYLWVRLASMRLKLPQTRSKIGKS